MVARDDATTRVASIPASTAPTTRIQRAMNLHEGGAEVEAEERGAEGDVRSHTDAGSTDHHIDLDLSEDDVDDGVTLARWVTELRAQAATGSRLRLHGCPQLLAHTLYKAGILLLGEIVIVSTRDEEPYG